MKFQFEVVLACLISLIWIQHVLCDDLSDTSGENKWACTCSSAYEGNQTFAVLANCASSCDCSPAAEGSSGNKWVCICDADKLPKVSADNHDAFCFTACNCKSGTTSEAESLKKRVSSKVAVVILLLCVILTTLVFIASIIWYVSRRDKGSFVKPVFSSDKESSYNSTTNLISHTATSMPEFKVCIGSPANPITGCIQKASLLFRSNTGTIPGTLLQFSYSELENATNKFSGSNLIGMGGSSHVYCGHFKDGGIVAVKRMKSLGVPDAESDFLTEIELISRLHHCHVVPLIGFCSENQGKHVERLLVFEYMPNGNLREYLDGPLGKRLDWSTRVAIALGAAKGLEYLHEAAAPRILHNDVKSTNILLDGNWRAKITDLGMAKRLINDGLPSCSSSPARMQGTFGYFAPEYAIVGRVSLKSDVFSFGVVLLELITGRHPIHKSPEKGEESLVIWPDRDLIARPPFFFVVLKILKLEWVVREIKLFRFIVQRDASQATPRLQDSRRVILELPDPRLQGNYPEEEMQVMAYLAKECLLLDLDSRPTMSEVVQILSTIAPEKSQRRNFYVNLFQSSSTCVLKNESAIKVPDKQNQDVVQSEELRRIKSNKWSPRCSLPLVIDRTLCIEKNAKGEDTDSEYVDKQILLTSNARSFRSQDDEMVDLTEPRLETFSVPNVRLPL